LEDLSISGKDIFNGFKRNTVWTGFNQPRTGTNGRPLRIKR
jgi:hypothetical protein